MCYYFSTLLGMDGFEQYQDPQRELGGNDSSLVQLAPRLSKKVVLWENLWDAGYAPVRFLHCFHGSVAAVAQLRGLYYLELAQNALGSKGLLAIARPPRMGNGQIWGFSC